MKVRIISGAVAVVLLVVVLLLHKTIVFPLCIAAICAIAIFELFRAKGCLRYRISFYAALLYTISAPILQFFHLEQITEVVMIAAIMILFLDGVVQHKRLKMDQVCFMMVSMLFVTRALGLLQVLLQSDAQFGLIYVILALCAAWIADTGAYFTGTFLGKHKLCPEVSPEENHRRFLGRNCIDHCGFLCIQLDLWQRCRSQGAVCLGHCDCSRLCSYQRAGRLDCLDFKTAMQHERFRKYHAGTWRCNGSV